MNVLNENCVNQSRVVILQHQLNKQYVLQLCNNVVLIAHCYVYEHVIWYIRSFQDMQNTGIK